MTNYHYYVPKTFYLVKYMDTSGHQFVLDRNLKTFRWNNSGTWKQYKTSSAARRMATKIRANSKFRNDTGDLMIVEVKWAAENPLNPDGSYTRVETVVGSV